MKTKKYYWTLAAVVLLAVIFLLSDLFGLIGLFTGGKKDEPVVTDPAPVVETQDPAVTEPADEETPAAPAETDPVVVTDLVNEAVPPVVQENEAAVEASAPDAAQIVPAEEPDPQETSVSPFYGIFTEAEKDQLRNSGDETAE